MLNFVKRPDALWALSLGIWSVSWFLFPAFRTAILPVMLLHVPVAVIGIFDLRLGFFCPALCGNPSEKNRCALTFDDGPDPVLTPGILAVLGRHGFTATFFVIADRVKQYPEVARSIVAEGHTVACHDLSHRNTDNFRRQRGMTADITAACRIIHAATGKWPLLYRPPVGLSNPHLRTALEKLGMTCIGWNRSIRDGGNRFAGRFRGMAGCSSPGAVIMLHDCLPRQEYRDAFIEHFTALCQQIQRKGLTSVTVDELFGIPAYREIGPAAPVSR